MKKNNFFWMLLNSIFLVVFNIYFFLLNKGVDQPPSVWISYSFIHLAYLSLLVTPFFVRPGSNSVNYGRPLFAITSSYFLLSLMAGVVFIIISPQNSTITLLVQLTITAVFAFLLLSNLIANERTADSVVKHEVELQYVKESSSRLEAMVRQASDKGIRKKVEKAYDALHSSQVKSSFNVKSIEQDVMDEINSLESALRRNNIEEIQLITDKICHLADERNRQLRIVN